jgi:hypothetical protein
LYCLEGSSSSLDDASVIALAVALGAGIPFLLVVALLIAAGIIAAVVIKRRQWGTDNWEISPSELEMEDHLGTGGYATLSLQSLHWSGLLTSQGFVADGCGGVGRIDTGACTRPSGAGLRWR